ncbi:MAG: tail fiber protein [Myxococcaceae bacterium]|nr:tail fiber protein [Myxococcaceae bacterium]MCI0672646.1 tail fiber protein [Myxococcaceae bacterium]
MLAPASGLTLTGTTLGTEPSVLQRRVAGACGDGFAVRAVNEDGSVVCAPILDARLGQPLIPDGSGGGSGTDCLLGQVFLFAGNFAPAGTMVADGRLLPINQHTALFSLLGNFHGGNGMTTFALPNLQPLAPAGVSYVICITGTFPSRP